VSKSAQVLSSFHTGQDSVWICGRNSRLIQGEFDLAGHKTAALNASEEAIKEVREGIKTVEEKK
jgi:hypothetical protein